MSDMMANSLRLGLVSPTPFRCPSLQACLPLSSAGPAPHPCFATSPSADLGTRNGSESGRRRDTVIVLDDDPLLRRSLVRWLGAEGFAANAFARPKEMFSALENDGAGCLLLDLELGCSDGFQVLAELRARTPDLPVIVLTGHGHVPKVVRAMRLGVLDFFTKPHDPDELRAAIVRALTRRGVDRPLAERQIIRDRAATLTARERAILRRVVQGRLNKQVAHELGLALITVKVHRGRAMRKLGIRSAADLGRIAHLADLL
jgi:FixJ family two-component response regulator